MSKRFKKIIISLFLILLFPNTAFAVEVERPPKPTEGIESSHPYLGNSWNDKEITSSSIVLITSYGCAIKNNGNSIYMMGTTTAKYLVERVSITLYLQKWDGSKWVDVRAYHNSNTKAKSITAGDDTYTFERGNYYRTRGVHYVKDGTETEYRYSVSSYIYVK